MNEWYKDYNKFQDNIINRSTTNLEWANRFLKLAKEISSWSKCASRKAGAVLVKDNIIIATGFNGSPKKSNLCQNAKYCPRQLLNYKSGEGLEICPAQHAEENCISSAAYKGVSTKDSKIYIYANTTPCKNCTGTLINAGIIEIYCVIGNIYDNLAIELLKSADVKLYLLKEIENNNFIFHDKE